jgi:nucleotide-binding universal stress UspA family protein
MYKHILIAYDGSSGAKRALGHPLTLAKTLASRIGAIWVRSTLPHFPETVDEIAEETEAADKYLARLKADIEIAARSAGVEILCEARSGHPAKSILRYAEEGRFDLIVLGSRGHSELWGRIMGHTADRVSENAHCDVLIVRSKDLPE